MIDTHFHLPEDIKYLDQEIQNAKNNNVNYFILGGTNVEENNEMIKISKKYSNIYLTLGYHPEYASRITKEDLELLKSQLKDEQVVAIGEIGLDYHYGENKDDQKKLFRKQLEIAQAYKLPVVIHSRDAVEDTYNILSEYDLKGVIHCFSGSAETARRYIKLGYKLGIGGVVTFKNSNLGETVKEIGLNNIVLETDSPYLSPIRGDINEPKNIKIIAEYLADITGLLLKEIAKITTNNAIELFDLDI